MTDSTAAFRLVDQALAGEDIVIARRKQPLVRLTVVHGEPGARKVGALRGLVRAMGDGFNDSMEDWSSDITPGAGTGKRNVKP